MKKIIWTVEYFSWKIKHQILRTSFNFYYCIFKFFSYSKNFVSSLQFDLVLISGKSWYFNCGSWISTLKSYLILRVHSTEFYDAWNKIQLRDLQPFPLLYLSLLVSCCLLSVSMFDFLELRWIFSLKAVSVLNWKTFLKKKCFWITNFCLSFWN